MGCRRSRYLFLCGIIRLGPVACRQQLIMFLLQLKQPPWGAVGPPEGSPTSRPSVEQRPLYASQIS